MICLTALYTLRVKNVFPKFTGLFYCSSFIRGILYCAEYCDFCPTFPTPQFLSTLRLSIRPPAAFTNDLPLRRRCRFPLEIGLRLQNTCRLHGVTVFSEFRLSPSAMEVYVAGPARQRRGIPACLKRDGVRRARFVKVEVWYWHNPVACAHFESRKLPYSCLAPTAGFARKYEVQGVSTIM